jgi:hypothetical protein
VIGVNADLDRRLGVAAAATGAADAKAGHLLAAAGVLAAAGGLWGAGARWSGPGLVLAWVASAALVVALVSLLQVLQVRGGDPRSWLLPGVIAADDELTKLAGIVAAKHARLSVAVRALMVAVLAGAAALAAAGVTR